MVQELPVDDTTRIRREAERQVRDRAVLDAILDAALVADVGVVRDGLPLVLRVPLDRVSVKVAAGPPGVGPDDSEPRSVWAGIVPLSVVAGELVPWPDVPADVDVPPSVHRTVDRFSSPVRDR
jgi:hypothetical protein